MKVLLDECTPLSWLAFLQQHGHETSHWAEHGFAGAAGADVIRQADRQQAAILTCDRDFGQLLWHGQATEPTVVQLGAPDWLPDVYGDAVLAALSECERQVERHFYVRVRASGQTYRIVTLPLGQ